MTQNTSPNYLKLLSKTFNENRWCFRRDLSEKEQQEAEIILQNIYDQIYSRNNELVPYSPDTHKTGSYLIYFSFVRTGQADISRQYMNVNTHEHLGTYQTALIVRSHENPIKDPEIYIAQSMDEWDYDMYDEIQEYLKSKHLQPCFQLMLDEDESLTNIINLNSLFSIPNEFNESLVFEVDESILFPLQRYLDHPLPYTPATLFADIPPAL